VKTWSPNPYIGTGIWGSGTEDARRKAFMWLTRIGAGPAFGSLPIGWYQQHQVAAIEVIEQAAKRRGVEHFGQVRVQNGIIEALDTPSQPSTKPYGSRWLSLGLSPRQVYDLADRKVRGA
jgi:hypothetical protein